MRFFEFVMEAVLSSGIAMLSTGRVFSDKGHTDSGGNGEKAAFDVIHCPINIRD